MALGEWGLRHPRDILLFQRENGRALPPNPRGIGSVRVGVYDAPKGGNEAPKGALTPK